VPANEVLHERVETSRVIDEQEQPLVSAEDARRSLQVTAAILRSAATGQTVNPAEIRGAA